MNGDCCRINKLKAVPLLLISKDYRSIRECNRYIQGCAPILYKVWPNGSFIFCIFFFSPFFIFSHFLFFSFGPQALFLFFSVFLFFLLCFSFRICIFFFILSDPNDWGPFSCQTRLFCKYFLRGLCSSFSFPSVHTQLFTIELFTMDLIACEFIYIPIW